jgi:hypothetical protein
MNDFQGPTVNLPKGKYNILPIFPQSSDLIPVRLKNIARTMDGNRMT